MIVESYEDVIVLSGSLSSNFWETIHTAISLTLRRHPTGVVIDCSGLTDATPAGAETFRDAMTFIGGHDARVIVAAVPDRVLNVLRTVPEVRSQLAVADSVEEARRSLDLLVAPNTERKKPVSAHSNIRVMVSLTGLRSDFDALRLSSRIADSILAEIHMVYVVVVPRDLPLQTPLPEQEDHAAKALEQGRAMLDGKNLANVSRLERGRDVAGTLSDLAKELQAHFVVVPLSREENSLEDNAKLVKSVLNKISAEVVFVRGGMDPATDSPSPS